MERFVPLEKMSKKEKRAHYAEKRGNWNGVNPVTKVVPGGKSYSRTKQKQDDRKAFRRGEPS